MPAGHWEGLVVKKQLKNASGGLLVSSETDTYSSQRFLSGLLA